MASLMLALAGCMGIGQAKDDPPPSSISSLEDQWEWYERQKQQELDRYWWEQQNRAPLFNDPIGGQKPIVLDPNRDPFTLESWGF